MLVAEVLLEAGAVFVVADFTMLPPKSPAAPSHAVMAASLGTAIAADQSVVAPGSSGSSGIKWLQKRMMWSRYVVASPPSMMATKNGCWFV